MQIVRAYSAVHERIAVELADAGHKDAATALEGCAVVYTHAGEGWSIEAATERAAKRARGAGRQLLREMADEIQAGLYAIADEAVESSDGGQSAAGFLLDILSRVTVAVSDEAVAERICQSVVLSAGGEYLPPRRGKTAVRESTPETAARPGQSDRGNEQSATHEPLSGVAGEGGKVKPRGVE